jgi:hypothetical protein
MEHPREKRKDDRSNAYDKTVEAGGQGKVRTRVGHFYKSGMHHMARHAKICRMSGVTLELEQALSQLDPRSATLLEQLVRDALALVRQKGLVPSGGPVDARGWPVGYFEKYAGCLVGDDWQPPADPPPDPIPTW